MDNIDDREAHFTSKLEGMFVDMKISKDSMDAFRQSRMVRLMFVCGT
jgi:hypothetical protein